MTSLPASEDPTAGQLDDKPQVPEPRPKVYPNNTLVEDLSRCHDNLRPGFVRSLNNASHLADRFWPRLSHLAVVTRLFGVQSEPAGRWPGDARPETTERNVDKKDKDYKFRMPTSIAQLNSTLSQDDYDRALCVLTGDIRYQLHLLLFRHLQAIWTVLSTTVCIVLPLLTLTNASALAILVTCSAWLLSQAAGFALCRATRRQLDKMLERSVAQANSFFMDHKLMLGVINVGSLTTQSRFVVPVLFFDSLQCIQQISAMIDSDMKSIEADGAADEIDEDNQRTLAQIQLAKRIVLSFSQRWISHFDKSKLLLSEDNLRPRHLSTGKCLCQFVEENLKGESGAEEGPAEVTPTAASPKSDTEARTAIEIPRAIDLAKVAGCTPLEPSSSPCAPACGLCELNVADLVSCLESRQRNLSSAQNNSEVSLENCFRYQVRADSGSPPESEVSLSVDGDDHPFGRNEELFNSLRLLLEIRSNELSKSFDAGSTLTLKNATERESAPMERERDAEMAAQGRADRPTTSSPDDQTLSLGKRFFSRVDGFLALGPKKDRGQGFYANSSQQLLDIC